MSLSLPISLDQFDFKCDLISLCRIDKQGDVYVDMNKIIRAVDWWKDRIYNLHENDYDSIKGEDENFRPYGYNIVNLYVFNEDFDLHGIKQYVPAIHDSESFDIQILADYVDSMRDYDQNEEECEEDDDFNEPGEYYWDNPDYDYIDNYWEYQDAIGHKYSGWAAFLYNIRSGAFGELPDDYNGLSWID